MQYMAILTDRKGFQKTLELFGEYPPDPVLEIPVCTQAWDPQESWSVDDFSPDRVAYEVLRFELVRIKEGYQDLTQGNHRVRTHFTAYYEELEEPLSRNPSEPPRQRRFIDTRKSYDP